VAVLHSPFRVALDGHETKAVIGPPMLAARPTITLSQAPIAFLHRYCVFGGFDWQRAQVIFE
jgi:hypothetical protein